MVRVDEQAAAQRAREADPEGPLARGAALTRALDRGTDVLVVAFALWTVIYHLSLPLDPPTWAMLAVWAVAGVAAGAGYARWRRARAGATGPGGDGADGGGADGDGDGPGGRGPGRELWRDAAVRTWSGAPRLAAPVAVVAGVGAGTAAGLREFGVPWWCTWTLGAVSVAATAVGLLRARATAPAPGPEGRPAAGRDSGNDGAAPPREGSGGGLGERWGSLIALVTAGGFAVASWFTVNPDGDDAYFVSRSVATATEGRIPAHDVIFSTHTTGPIAGEPPVSSVEVLAGALARVVGMHPTSFLWYVVLPAVTFVAVWALWRLIRAWAPRWAPACFGVAVVYLLWSGVGQASLGSFHLLRMWQGKAMMVSIMVPLLYVYLTRWAERRTAGALALAAAAGTAAVGLSSSATLVVPLVTVAAAGALVLSGRVRTGAAACAAMVYPLGAGLAVVLLHDDIHVIGPFTDAPVSYSWVLLSATLGVLTGCALWLGSRAARPGVPALITGGVAGVATLLFLPGVLDLVAGATGAAQVMWRTMWTVPAPALVGLLAAAVRPPARLLPSRLSSPGARGPLAAAVPVALCAVMVAGGVPLWSKENGTTVAQRPSWKISARDLATVRAVLRAEAARGTDGPAVVLMPQQYMRVMPLLSTTDHAINPNSHYLRLLPAPRPFIDDRLMLSALVTSPGAADPAAGEVRGALRRTGVTVACARRSDEDGLRLLEAAGYGGRSRAGRLTCVFPGRS
ncbi:DUF6077 domain-containing protein [Spirillospora sp. CA-255316]